MKTIARLLIATLALGLTAATAQAADTEESVAARFAPIIEKLQKADILTAEDADYLKQNATGAKGSKCDTAKIVPIVIAIVNKTGGKAANLDEAMDYIAEKKAIGNPDNYRKLLAAKTIAGSSTRSLLMTLSRRIK